MDRKTMDSDIRRIIAVDAHWRRTGYWPVHVYSLGTGESFEIGPLDDGFVDLTSGLTAQSGARSILVPEIGGTIDVELTGDVTFAGYDHLSGQRFTGRSGGGATVTLYDANDRHYFQYAIARVKNGSSQSFETHRIPAEPRPV